MIVVATTTTAALAAVLCGLFSRRGGRLNRRGVGGSVGNANDWVDGSNNAWVDGSGNHWSA